MTVITVALTFNLTGGVTRLQLLRTKIFIEEIKREKRHIIMLLFNQLSVVVEIHSVLIARGIIIGHVVHIYTVG
jgi:hypothetical protein